MDERLYKVLVRTAIILSMAWIGWALFDSTTSTSPDSQALAAAARHIEDGQFNAALRVYDKLLTANPQSTPALYGKAFSHMQIGLEKQETQEDSQSLHTALIWFDRTIAAEQQKSDKQNRTLLGVSFANRGIVRDRLGDHTAALADYRQAMALEPEVADGPGWLTRFLRNQATAPPTVADRANYLAQQLSLPADERQLTQPDLDHQQRRYKM